MPSNLAPLWAGCKRAGVYSLGAVEQPVSRARRRPAPPSYLTAPTIPGWPFVETGGFETRRSGDLGRGTPCWCRDTPRWRYRGVGSATPASRPAAASSLCCEVPGDLVGRACSLELLRSLNVPRCTRPSVRVPLFALPGASHLRPLDTATLATGSLAIHTRETSVVQIQLHGVPTSCAGAGHSGSGIDCPSPFATTLTPENAS